MKKFLFMLFLFYFSILYAERYMIEFSGEIPERKASGFIKENKKYKFVVVDSDYNSIKSAYPDAVKIYREPKVRAFYTPNDTYYSYQWSLHQAHYNLSFLLDREILGSRSVVIGILDTGVSFEDYPIPTEEQGLVVSSTNSYSMYPDFEGVNFVQGYDFVSDDSHPNDMNGHGTAVTSIIASTINNARATAGIVMEVSIMPLRVLDHEGAGNLTDILDAIEYGVSNGCRVLNLSLGGAPGDSSGWSILHQAIKNARNSNVMVVAASGNEGVSMLSYPAGFEEVTSVGAVDYFFKRTPYSQYGTNLDFVSPGGYVYQDIDNDGEDEGGILCPMPEQTASGANVNDFYLYFVEGTSFSAPHLSALAALLYSMGYSTVDEITDIMIDGSLDLGSSGYDSEYGWGYPKPDSLFSQPIAVKTVRFEKASNIVFYSIIILNDTFQLDSLTISSLLVNENLSYKQSGNLVIAEFQIEKSGLYSVTAFGQKNGEFLEFKRDIALRSLVDPSNVVYNKNIQMFSDNPYLLFFENNKIISSSDNSSVRISCLTDEPKSACVFLSDMRIPVSRYSNRIEFEITKKGPYRILKSGFERFPLNTKTAKRTILYTEDVLTAPSEDAHLYDKSGRVVSEPVNGAFSFKNLPAGTYFIKSKDIMWKVTKLF